MSSEFDSKINAIASELADLSSQVVSNDDARKRLLDVVSSTVRELESPVETVLRMGAAYHPSSALMSLLSMGILHHLNKAQTPVSASDLAKATGGNETLIVRLMRPVTALKLIREVDVESYETTPFVNTILSPPLLGGYTFMFTCAADSLSKMPDYLASTGYQDVDGTPGPFQHAKSTKLSMFSWLSEHPELMDHFNKSMRGVRDNVGTLWFQEWPVEEFLLKNTESDAESVLIVDVGGGEGHDLARFLNYFPKAPGRLVLQDMQETISNIKDLDPRIERQVHDFFKPQPVKGARAYFFSQIFHDWGSEECRKILRQIAGSMKAGYSKLLINELILPAKNVDLYGAIMDVNMMCLLNGRERSEKQWTELLDSVGFKIVKFYVPSSPTVCGLIEAELK